MKQLSIAPRVLAGAAFALSLLNSAAAWACPLAAGHGCHGGAMSFGAGCIALGGGLALGIVSALRPFR